MSAPASFSVEANVEDQDVKPGAQVQWKRFNFHFPDQGGGHQNNPLGWNWTRWTLTLQRVALPDQPAFATFLGDWEAASYGRWSGDYTPWPFILMIFSDQTPLREFELGRRLIGKGITSGPALQGSLPGPVLGPFPEPYFALINRVRLHGEGNQESN